MAERFALEPCSTTSRRWRICASRRWRRPRSGCARRSTTLRCSREAAGAVRWRFAACRSRRRSTSRHCSGRSSTRCVWSARSTHKRALLHGFRAELQASRERLLEATKERKAIEKLKERWLAEVEARNRRAEQTPPMRPLRCASTARGRHSGYPGDRYERLLFRRSAAVRDCPSCGRHHARLESAHSRGRWPTRSRAGERRARAGKGRRGGGAASAQAASAGEFQQLIQDYRGSAWRRPKPRPRRGFAPSRTSPERGIAGGREGPHAAHGCDGSGPGHRQSPGSRAEHRGRVPSSYKPHGPYGDPKLPSRLQTPGPARSTATAACHLRGRRSSM